MPYELIMGDTELDSKVPDGPIDQKWTLGGLTPPRIHFWSFSPPFWKVFP